MNDDVLLNYWASYQSATGSKPASIQNRMILLRALLRRTGESFATITRQDLILDQGRPGLTPATRANYKSLLHGFFTWLQDEGFRLDNPAAKLPKVRIPRTEPDPVTTADIERLLHSGIYRRTRMWVLLYAYQGMRAGEIAAVSNTSIDWDRHRILSIEAKGGVEVWRPLHPLVYTELQRWRGVGWLFPSHTRPGEHVTAKNVSNVLSKAFKRAGILHRPHQMRAWFATELIDAGTPTLIVAAAMRHADTQTIRRYVKVKDDAIGAAILHLPVVRVPEHSGRKVA